MTDRLPVGALEPLKGWRDVKGARNGFAFAKGRRSLTIPFMTAIRELGRRTARRFFCLALVAGLTCACQAQRPEVDEIRAHAEKGEAEAQNTIGLAYKNGHGVAQDFTQALKWFQKSADQGYASAQKNLGLMYAEGKGLKQDFEQAIKWLRKAAEQNFASAQNHLAMLYLEGKIPTHDLGEAVKWLRKAAESNYAEAQDNLG